MSSSIAPARAALYTLLVAAAGDPSSALADVQITFGYPDQLEQQEVVCLLGVIEPSESSASLRPRAPREEKYKLELAVKVYNPAASSNDTAITTTRDLDVRVWAIAEAVREIVNANLTLTDTVRTAYVVLQKSDGPLAPVDASTKRLPGFVMRVDLHVECEARI
jgi:hypothetical protein